MLAVDATVVEGGENGIDCAASPCAVEMKVAQNEEAHFAGRGESGNPNGGRGPAVTVPSGVLDWMGGEDERSVWEETHGLCAWNSAAG